MKHASETTTTGSNRFAFPSMWSARNAEDAGTAKRRRERWLREFLRHERLTVAMLLAETQHHAAPRGQNMARSREEESEMHNGQTTLLSRAASTMYFSLDDDGDVLAAWPDRHYEVRPQDRLLRRTVEQNVDAVMLPSLDVPEPQMEPVGASATKDRHSDLAPGYRSAQDLS